MIDSIAASIGLTAGSNILLIAFSLSRGYGMSLTSITIPCHQKCVFNVVESVYPIGWCTKLLLKQLRTPFFFSYENVYSRQWAMAYGKTGVGHEKTPSHPKARGGSFTMLFGACNLRMLSSGQVHREWLGAYLMQSPPFSCNTRTLHRPP